MTRGAQLLGCMFLLLVTTTVSFADSDLMVYPSRLVMTDQQRSGQVDIINSGQLQATYRITLVRKRMTESGQFQEVSTPDPQEKFADDLVKYSPRQVTLLPGGSQTIRMMFRAPSTLEEGEYRSHLLLSKAPDAVKEPPRPADQEAGTISMNIVTNIGISIPIIVRHGNLTATAAIDPASANLLDVGGKQQLVFTLSRTGTRSVYGDVAVYVGKEKVAESNGIAVYVPNAYRKMGVPLDPSHRVKSGDTVRITFTERDEKKPMADAIVVIP